MFDKKKKLEQVLEQPLDNKIRKTSYTTQIVHDNGEFKVKKITKFKVYSEQFRKWIPDKPNLTELLPLESLGAETPLKEVTISIIIMKPIVEADGELGKGYFLTTVHYKVNADYPAVYLRVARNTVIQTHLGNKQSSPLPVFEPIQGITVTLGAKGRRILYAEAVGAERNGVPIFEKQKNGSMNLFIDHSNPNLYG